MIFFNQNINKVNFPNSLTHIGFYGKFNQNIDKVNFPNSLKNISFVGDFNQNIDLLPVTLVNLNLSKKTN